MKKTLLSILMVGALASLTAQEDVTSNLVFYLNGDEAIGTNITSSVGANTYDGAVTGTITHSAGADGTPNSAFNFTASSWIDFVAADIVDLPINGIDPVSADGSAPRTLSLWFKTTNTSHQDMLTYGSTSNGQHVHYHLNNNNGSVKYGHWNIDFSFNDTPDHSDGEWHHVVYILFDDAGTLTASLFFDGVKQTNIQYGGGNTLATNIVTTTNLKVGGRNATTGDQFLGDLDEIRLYNRVLTDAQALQLYTDNGGTLSTPKVDKLANFSAYVESGILKIKSDVQIDEIEVYSLTGAKVKVFSNDDNKDISGLSKGLYILNVKAENVEHAAKLLVK